MRVFEAAHRITDRASRRELVARECGNNRALRVRVESLLRVLDEEGTFLTSPIPAAEFTASLVGDYAGTVIGPYRLTEQIGEGGMGTVYQAEQSEPVRRQVALKIIKPGMDSRQIIGRFEAERQALALMDHPNIAKILDAGMFDGRPFFVMELVRGESITTYCDEHRLTPRQRLELFVPACQAVQHAHQKGVIHRDLKPSNILVTQYDGRPVPKVIDFGVAKATGPRIAGHTLATGLGAIVGTLEYMSPEQADPDQNDVDTRSDVYSLGVVLYELLTGTTPLQGKRLKHGAWLEILRMIREVEPPKPSTRLSTAEGLPSIAANRGLEPKRLGGVLRGDLDWVVMKCLEKDRGRRYATANGLARDIQRYLNQEPVEASPPSSVYRLKNLLRRNRGAVFAASTIFALLIAGIVGTTIGLVRAERRAKGERQAKELAEKRLAQIEKGIDILSSVFEKLDPREEEKEGRPLRTLLGDRLQSAAQQLDGEAVGNPVVVAGLQNRLGQSLLNLGMPGPAMNLLLKARATRASTLGSDHPDTLTTMNNLALAYKDAGKMDQALPLHEETLKRRRLALGDDHPDTLTSMNNLAAGFRDSGKMALAVPLHEESLRLRKAKLGLDHVDTLIGMSNLAMSYHVAGKLDLAFPLYEETLRLRKAKLGPDHRSTLTSMNNLALAYKAVGKLDQAVLLHEETLKRRKATQGPDHPDTLSSMNNLAADLQGAGKFDLALPLTEETLRLLKSKRGVDHPETLTSMNNLAEILLAVGRLDEALPLYEETLTLRKAKLGRDHPRTLSSMHNLASGLKAAGRMDRAVPLLEETVKLRKAKLGDDHADTLHSVNNLAALYRDIGRLDAAETLFLEAATGAERKLGLSHPQTQKYITNLADLYEKQDKLAEAARWRAKLPAARP